MKLVLSTSALVSLLLLAANAHAWQQTPYSSPYGTSWPNAWPQQQQNMRPNMYPNNFRPQAYGNKGWKMRGYMTQQGDVNVVIEYQGNINNGFRGAYGGGFRQPGYGAYPQSPYYGWR